MISHPTRGKVPTWMAFRVFGDELLLIVATAHRLGIDAGYDA